MYPPPMTSRLSGMSLSSSAGGVHHAVGAQLERAGHGRDRTAGQDAMLKRQPRLGIGRRVATFELKGLRILERRPSVNDRYLALLGQLLQTAGQRADDLVLALGVC